MTTAMGESALLLVRVLEVAGRVLGSENDC